jgi:hypothetical protein
MRRGIYRRRSEIVDANLHDPPDYVIGDLISPLKATVGIDYKDFESRLPAAIHIRSGPPPKTGGALESLERFWKLAR